MECDYLIVGAGIFGTVVAERIANDLGASVVVIDKRPHIAGNCYSEKDTQTDIEVHRYGTHVFHTSIRKTWEYISRFTELNGYRHQVLATHNNRVYQMPINLETINSFYNLNLNPAQAEKFISEEIRKENINLPANLEEKAISLIGKPLYETFIKSYTIKQWGKDPRELPSSIITRLPLRFDYREDYFNDTRWQGIPVDGYTKMFERMLDAPNIKVLLNCDYFMAREEFRVNKKVIYTGPIDQYFSYCHGKLEWRSIELKRALIEVKDYQGTSVMNYVDNKIPYTRIHEPRHLHPERQYNKEKTVIFYEYPGDNPEEPYYSVNTDKNNLLAQKYHALLEQKDIIIGGHLGDYAYYNMDKTIMSALECYENKILKSKTF